LKPQTPNKKLAKPSEVDLRLVMAQSKLRTPPADAIVVLASSLSEDEDPSVLVQSNVQYLDLLAGEYIRDEEMNEDALRSYQVDYFLMEWENGGFSQFVYNTHWDPIVVRRVREGLAAMGAKRILKVFEKAAKTIDGLGKDALQKYLEGSYFHEDDEEGEEEDDPVDWEAIDEALAKAADKEDIAELHGNWLRKHPKLFPMETEEDMRAEARRRGAALPDREARKAKALAERPRFERLIDALCKKAGHELDRLTTIDPNREFEGETVRAYHFLTDEGHHYLVERDGKAYMIRGDTNIEVCSIDAPPDPVVH
jgi:Domain of unknown function (DUF4375)